MKYRLKLVQEDITTLKVDAIVNAANASLLDGCGVNGEIHRAAGPQLLDACKQLNGCLTGHAKITNAYNLQAKYIIHTVGPIWRGGVKGEPQLLASCYTTSLKLAVRNGIKSLAFPAISCGIYGYPVTQAATIAVSETANFLHLHENLNEVFFVCFDKNIYDAYQQALSALTYDE
jgi:O-acetyl-ADP-ribose deacetylase (regulator of RNase III)